MRRRRPRASDLWTGIILTAGLVEAWALRGKRRDATASHFIRLTFRTDSVAGKLGFVVSWAALSAWLVPHILSEDIKETSDQP